MNTVLSLEIVLQWIFVIAILVSAALFFMRRIVTAIRQWCRGGTSCDNCPESQNCALLKHRGNKRNPRCP